MIFYSNNWPVGKECLPVPGDLGYRCELTGPQGPKAPRRIRTCGTPMTVEFWPSSDPQWGQMAQGPLWVCIWQLEK